MALGKVAKYKMKGWDDTGFTNIGGSANNFLSLKIFVHIVQST